MKTVWEYSPESEASRLIHCAHQISTGFFRLNNFMVVPYKSGRKYDENEVSLPDLNYPKISRFWGNAGKIKTKTLPLSVPENLLLQTLSLVNTAKLPRPNYSRVQKLWDRHQDKILNEIYKLIPGKINYITGITIWPTVFGTNCTFSLLNKKPGRIYLWLREGSGITSIVEAILSALTRMDVYDNLNGLWRESEIIVDWILAYSSLGKLLKKLDPTGDRPYTIQKTRKKQEASMVAESEKFLKKIGAPVVEHTFSLDNGSILVRQKSIENLLPREKETLRLLVSKSPNIVTVDEVADILFAKNEDAFSLYAIAKFVQRLRDKLEENGVSGSFIQTKRGEGFLLVN